MYKSKTDDAASLLQISPRNQSNIRKWASLAKQYSKIRQHVNQRHKWASLAKQKGGGDNLSL